jgi:hypothetical protein
MSKYSFDIPQESEVMKEFLKIASEEKLYDVETNEDSTAKELIEKSHPEKESVEVTDTYGENTGLVENLTQQQEVGIDIANKMPDNKVSRKTMAELNLHEEITLIADEMRLRGEDDLELFAKKLEYSLKKKAALPAVAIAGIIAVPALISAYLYGVHGTDPVDYGVEKNLTSLWYAIEEYKQNRILGEGSEQGNNISTILDRLQNISVAINKKRNEYMSAMEQFSNMLNSAPKSRSKLDNINPEDVKNEIKDRRSALVVQYMEDWTNKYKSSIKRILPELMRTHAYLEKYFERSEDFASDETGERSTWSQLWEKTKEFGGYFAKSDEQHILDALGTAINSLKVEEQNKQKETSILVKNLSKPIEEELKEDFDIEKAKADIASANKPKENE